MIENYMKEINELRNEIAVDMELSNGLGWELTNGYADIENRIAYLTVELCRELERYGARTDRHDAESVFGRSSDFIYQYSDKYYWIAKFNGTVNDIYEVEKPTFAELGL